MNVHQRALHGLMVMLLLVAIIKIGIIVGIIILSAWVILYLFGDHA